MAEITRESRYRVDGMDCAGCAGKIDTAIRRISGVEDVAVSLTRGTMTVQHADQPHVEPAIQRQVRKLGYSLRPVGNPGVFSDTPSAIDDHTLMHDEAPWWRQPRIRLTFFYGLGLLAALAAGQMLPASRDWLFLAAVAFGLVPIARRALSAAVAGTPFSIETLMTIAAIGAVIIGATQEAAVVILLFLIGELLEGLAAGRSRASIRGLVKLMPKTARIERADGRIEEIPTDRLSAGDIIIVRPGDRIAADGEVLSGQSSVDEAPVTGESVPNVKAPGDPVYAGTVNGEAVLRLRVKAGAEDNTIARIIRLVEDAQERKAPTERFINRFSSYYTPGVVALAAAVALLPPLAAGEPWLEWVYKGLAILLIGCPCALVISTPAAIAAGLSAGARRGLLMKGGTVLEEAGRLQVIGFDKTGTLTEGRPKVTDIVSFGCDEREVLRLAAALEQGSSHPLALAVLDRAAEDGLSIPAAADAAARGGKGVTGTVDGRNLFFGSAAAAMGTLSPEQEKAVRGLNREGKTVSVLTLDNEALGLIGMRDEPRSDARSGLERLRAAGIRTIMLTGDNAATAETIGRALGIEVQAQLLPEDKSRIIDGLRDQGLRVGKVGDGINDAPALAAADIGIAMGGGTDVALETADAAILHGRVRDVAAMVELSRRTMSNIRQNIAIAIGLKLAFLVTTILGITGLWPAILADTGATVLVTANALRLLAWTPRAEKY